MIASFCLSLSLSLHARSLFLSSPESESSASLVCREPRESTGAKRKSKRIEAAKRRRTQPSIDPSIARRQKKTPPQPLVSLFLQKKKKNPKTKQEAAAEEAPAAAAPAAAAAAPVFGSASTFGAGSGFAGFTGVAGAVAAAAAAKSSGGGEGAVAAGGGDGDEDDDAAGGAGGEDDECQAEFKPVVQLAEVETVSGEEAEEALCDVKSKLYRFDHGSGEWKERGVGQVRLLRHRENDRIRLLFRQEKTLKVRANHVVMPGTSLKPHSGSDKALVWSAVDFSGDEQATELFCIRFASPERAQEFKGKFEEAMAHNDKVIGGGGDGEEGGEKEEASPSKGGEEEGAAAAAGAAADDDAKAAAEAKLKAEGEKKAEAEAEADKLAAEVGEKAAVKEEGEEKK